MLLPAAEIRLVLTMVSLLAVQGLALAASSARDRPAGGSSEPVGRAADSTPVATDAADGRSLAVGAASAGSRAPGDSGSDETAWEAALESSGAPLAGTNLVSARPPALDASTERPGRGPGGGAAAADPTRSRVAFPAADEGAPTDQVLYFFPAPPEAGDARARLVPDALAGAAGGEASWGGELAASGRVDTRRQPRPEPVGLLATRALLRLDLRSAEGPRVHAELGAFWWAAGRDPGAPYPLLGFNVSRPFYDRGVELRAAWVQLPLAPGLHLRLGEQVFAWGQNDFLPAGDVLCPLDLRGVYQAEGGPPRAPVLAAELAWSAAPWELRLVYQPFFAPHRFYLLDADRALAPAGSALAGQLALLSVYDPTLRGQLGETFPGHHPPSGAPANGSLALRAAASLAGWDLGVALSYGWDRTPLLALDPDLALLAANSERITARPELLATDPALREALTALEQKAALGLELVRADYRRLAWLGLDAGTTLGELVVKLDVGATPGRVSYDEALVPRRGPALQLAAGLEWSSDATWYVTLTPYWLLTWPPAGSGRLQEFGRGPVEASQQAWGLVALARYTAWQGDLRLQLLAAYNGGRGDHLLDGLAEYRVTAAHYLTLRAWALQGPAGSLGSHWGDDDAVQLGWRWVF